MTLAELDHQDDRRLYAAIGGVGMRKGFESYLDIVDTFYSEDVEVILGDGGVLCDIADAAMGVAFASSLDADQSLTTLELKINFLRPVWESMLQAKARV